MDTTAPRKNQRYRMIKPITHRQLPSLGCWCNLLGAILGAPLLAVGYPLGIQRSAHNVIAHARQVLHTSTAYQDHRVFLQVVAFSGDVSCYFHPIGEPHTSNFAQRRVWLLWCNGTDFGTHTPFLGRTAPSLELSFQRVIRKAQCGRFGFLCHRLAWFTNQLIDCWHCCMPLLFQSRINKQKNTKPFSGRAL